MDGQEQGAFCWELAFPEVFYQPNGQRRDDAGFSCVLGNPPWDKIKPERDGFYLAYDPLIRQFQGTQKNRRIEELHQENPAIAEAWRRYEFQTGTAGGRALGRRHLFPPNRSGRGRGRGGRRRAGYQKKDYRRRSRTASSSSWNGPGSLPRMAARSAW